MARIERVAAEVRPVHMPPLTEDEQLEAQVIRELEVLGRKLNAKRLQLEAMGAV